MGSKICIRDSIGSGSNSATGGPDSGIVSTGADACANDSCVLYTSDAADELLCVNLRGRRFIKIKMSYYYKLPLPTR